MVDADRGASRPARGRASKAQPRKAQASTAQASTAQASTAQANTAQASTTGASTQAAPTAANNTRTAVADLCEALNEIARRLARQQDELVAQAQDDLDSVARECDEALREPAATLRAATESAEIREAEDAYRTAHREQSRQAADREIVIRTELSAALEGLEQQADDEISQAWIKFGADAGQALTQAAENAGTPGDVRELRRQLQILASVAS